MEYNELLKRYKHLIKIGSKPVPELIDYLKNKLTVQEISSKEFPNYYCDAIKSNAYYCLLNDELQIQPDEMVFRFFKVIMDKRAKQYLAEEPHNILWGMCYIVFEERTGYIDSSSNKLFLDIMLERGVPQEDYDNEGLQFRCLLTYFDR